MRQSRFIELILSLSPVDFIALKFFLKAELYNKNKNLLILYDAIINYSQGRSINEITLFEKFNAAKKISKANFRMVLSGFSNLIETYLIHKAADEDKLTSYINLLKYAFDNNLQYLLNKTILQLSTYFEGKVDLNAQEKFAKIQFLKIKSLLSYPENKKLTDVLNSLYLEIALQSGSGKFFPADTKIINKAKKNDLQTYCYFLMNKINSGNLSGLEELEKIFEISGSKELKNSISACFINQNNIEVKKHLKYAEWYWQNAAKREKILHANKILFIALQNYEIELSKNIVKYIEAGNTDGKAFFSVALYYFYFNDFTKCLTELDKIFPEDKEEDAQIRQLKMCCYVRLNYLKKFNDAFYAFKKFASANKKSELINQTDKFCRILFQIANNKSTLDKLLKIENLISKAEILNKNWLENELNYHFKNLA